MRTMADVAYDRINYQQLLILTKTPISFPRRYFCFPAPFLFSLVSIKVMAGRRMPADE